MSAMADVLAQHAIAGLSGGTHIACRCDRIWVPSTEYRTHLAAALVAAGFGPVREAQEEAWDECEAATYEIRLNPTGNAWEPVKDNPYRKASA
jgi:hypothetical protein